MATTIISSMRVKPPFRVWSFFTCISFVLERHRRGPKPFGVLARRLSARGWSLDHLVCRPNTTATVVPRPAALPHRSAATVGNLRGSCVIPGRCVAQDARSSHAPHPGGDDFRAAG
jgi:hypothetical protein